MVARKPPLIVVGNGMVGYKFLEYLVATGEADRHQIHVFGAEPVPAYDRIHLTDLMSGGSAERLTLAPRAWYRRNGIELQTGVAVHAIDRVARTVQAGGRIYPWRRLVLATGSRPFVPPWPGIEGPGVYVYRTLADVAAIVQAAAGKSKAAVLGGGLLGLEAAKALRDLGLDVTVVEHGPTLMGRQVDAAGGELLAGRIRALGVKLLLGARGSGVVPRPGGGLSLDFEGQAPIDVDLLVVAAGIRPDDALARAAGLARAERGGIRIDDDARTEDPDIFAIGECASHAGVVYGLAAPGYRQAEAAAAAIEGMPRPFTGMHQSTKLKLLGVDVASVGESVPPPGSDWSDLPVIAVHDDMRGAYKKLILNPDRSLRGAVLVGDASEYGRLLQLCLSGQPLPDSPVTLLAAGGSAVGPAADELVCTCNVVGREAIVRAVGEGCHDLPTVMTCTGAGTGCGGCKPQVLGIIHREMERLGIGVDRSLCPHFSRGRAELYDIVRVRGLRSFDAVIAAAGRGHGCEICRPAVAAILASAWGQTAADTPDIQDTNDRFLANIQRGGTYSVVPRIPGGEITPDKLIVLGEIAREYGLYLKFTGGQRLDMFGARREDLPSIWARLVAAGFESGHAYAKALRTVKSCVGSAWCRFGVLDSTAMAILVEERYKGLRAPHKLKSAVSGCIRECAEARSKDFGIIATEEGWSLYVGGNGGAKPRHAELLAGGLDTEACIRLIDRFLMYYIRTADLLTRTSTWIENLDGGLVRLKRVLIDDELGLGEELEAQMRDLVGAWRCEWRQVVEDPALAARFRAFANSEERAPDVRFVHERGQIRPASGGGFVELARIGRVAEIEEVRA
jgi:nitrite reductase (NADH) large subunit